MKQLLKFLTLTAMSIMLAACGQIIPQNQVALGIKSVGERRPDASSSNLYWATRIPMDPTLKVYTFPLGLQDYEFSERKSFESPDDQAIQVDCIGSILKFDVNVQLYINHDDPQLKEKLFAFINEQQLQNFAGSPDMLSKWVGSKMKTIIREPLNAWTLPKQAIDVMHGKKDMNEILLRTLNERFNKYAIIFSSAGITSAIHLPEDQKKRMAGILQKEYDNNAMKLRIEKHNPLLAEINQINQVGLTNIQIIKNKAESDAINIVAEAQQQRRATFTGLIGEENYIELELMLTMVRNLSQSNGGTHVMIVPKGLNLMGMPPDLFRPSTTTTSKPVVNGKN